MLLSADVLHFTPARHLREGGGEENILSPPFLTLASFYNLSYDSQDLMYACGLLSSGVSTRVGWAHCHQCADIPPYLVGRQDGDVISTVLKPGDLRGDPGAVCVPAFTPPAAVVSTCTTS